MNQIIVLNVFSFRYLIFVCNESIILIKMKIVMRIVDNKYKFYYFKRNNFSLMLNQIKDND